MMMPNLPPNVLVRGGFVVVRNRKYILEHGYRNDDDKFVSEFFIRDGFPDPEDSV